MGLDASRETGRKAVAEWRSALSRRLAELVKDDDELAQKAMEVGLVDRDWLDDPGNRPITTTGPVDMLQRYLERTAEQRPGVTARLGLSTFELLNGLLASDEKGTTSRQAVVFTDLESFTQYTSRHGDEAAAELLAEHHRRAGPVVRSRGGTQVKRLGDGLLLTFPSSEAAVSAALDLLDTAPEPLRLRAGAHIGDVMTVDGDVVGHTVNVAARVAGVTKAGRVSVTAAIRDEAGDLPGIEFGRLRRKSFKGVDETVQICSVSRAGS